MGIILDPEGFTPDGDCVLSRRDSIHAEGECLACDSEWSRMNPDDEDEPRDAVSFREDFHAD